MVAKDSLTTVDIEDLAQALGFNNTQEMNEFQCEMQQGTNDLKATYIDPFVTNPEDSFTILGATERYATTAINPTEFDENVAGNFLLVSYMSTDCTMFSSTSYYSNGFCEDIRRQKDAIAGRNLKIQLVACGGAGVTTFEIVTVSTFGFGTLAGAFSGVIIGGGCGILVYNNYLSEKEINRLEYEECKVTHK